MYKKFVSFISIVIILTTLSLAPTHAAVQAGSACKKAGITTTASGKTFTCIKSGKRLVWDKGAIIKKFPSPPIQPSNSVNTNTKRYSQALIIQKFIDDAQKIDTSTQLNPRWIYEGETNENIKKPTEEGLNKAIKFYFQLGFTTDGFMVFVTKSEPWLREQMVENRCTLNTYLDALGWYAPFSCQDGGSYIVARHWSSVSLTGGLKGLAFQHVLAHEYFHMIQQTYSGRYGNVAPIWFWEGGAHFYSVVAYSTWNSDKNYEDWLDYLLKVWRDDTYEQCKQVRLQEIPNTGTWESRRCGYSKGAKAVEYFVSKYGSDKYKQILTLLSSNDFNSAFEKATNQKLSDFYIEVDKFFESQGWN